jgi:uncharacterized protein YvpB
MDTFLLLVAYLMSLAAPSMASGIAAPVPAKMVFQVSASQERLAGAASLPILRTPTRTPTKSSTSISTAKASPTRTATVKTNSTALANKTSTPKPNTTPTKIVVKGRVYDAYLPAATKAHQDYQYSCEFDAAWVILKTNGLDVNSDQQAAIVGMSKGPEPYYKETKQGIFIYGGDITKNFSGDYKKNFLARSTGQAMRKVFEKYGLSVTPVNTREGIQAALLRGELVWIKTTVDFKPWKVATWVMPDGRTHKTVLGNDHAAVVMGFNKDVAVIRDVLGPTSTGRSRSYEYEVPWAKFMASWGAQSFDGLAVGKPR